MSRLSIFIDIDKCTGCHNCFLACRDEYCDNDYPGYSAAQPAHHQFWLQIKEIERGTYPRPKLSNLPLPCLHCEDAPCMEAAENGAVYRREDGIVLIDPQKAEGQERIVNACPYRVIFWNAEKRIPQKCTLCAHRLDEGEKQPRCVESCPPGALVFGDLDDPESDIVKAMAGKQVEDYRPEFKTRPLVRYSGIPKKFVAGEVVLEDRQEECAQGVKISLEGGGTSLATQTDTFGDFEFEGLANRTAYVLNIVHKGYKPRTIEFTTMTDVNLGEIVLSPN
jgi:Fe-S-cluster-containing dehydrogenase component